MLRTVALVRWRKRGERRVCGIWNLGGRMKRAAARVFPHRMFSYINFLIGCIIGSAAIFAR
jgi:hypothetical protein